MLKEEKLEFSKPIFAFSDEVTIGASYLAAISICSFFIISVCDYRVESLSISSNLWPDDVIGNAPDVTLNSNWPTWKSFYSFLGGLLEIQLLLMENCVRAAETGWVWTEGSTSSKDTCSKIWGDGTDAAVKDGAATVAFKGMIIYYLDYSLGALIQKIVMILPDKKLFAITF